jgi:hypothetical protein
LKINKIQTEVFKNILRESRGFYYKISDTEILVSPDNFKAFSLPLKTIAFNTDMMKLMPENNMFIKKSDDELIKATNILKIMNNKQFARKFLFETKGSIWINNAFLDYFDNPILYARNKLERVLVYERGRCGEQFVGIITPIRVSDED